MQVRRFPNYSGTATVDGRAVAVTGVPGIYALEATSSAEEVALKLLHEDVHVLVCVLDATNLVVFALNMVDVAEQRGIVSMPRPCNKRCAPPSYA